MTPSAYVSHALPGRLRIKVPSKRGDEDYFSNVKGALVGCAGVMQVRAHPLTTSILVVHDVTLDLKDFAAYARDNTLFSLQRTAIEPVPVSQWASSSLRRLDERLKQASGGFLDIRSLLFIALLAMAISQIMRGQIMVPALTLLWYAIRLLNDRD